MPEFMDPDLMQLVKAIVLVVGFVISSTFFWLGWKIYRYRGWDNLHHHYIYVPKVDRRTNRRILVPRLPDWIIDEILATPPKPFRKVGHLGHIGQ
jgi:hypothetical protein